MSRKLVYWFSQIGVVLSCTLIVACGGGGGGGAAGVGGTNTPDTSATSPITPEVQRGLNWSDAATWGGTKPVAGAAVLVPAGMRLLLDEDTPALGALTIEGELIFKSDTTAQLRASTIMVRTNGALRAGTALAPFTGRATITLTSMDSTASLTGMGTRGNFGQQWWQIRTIWQSTNSRLDAPKCPRTSGQ